LRSRRAFPPQCAQYGNSAPFRDITGEKFRLIESPLHLLAPVQGHRNYRIETLIDRNCALQKSSQRPREWFHPGVFEEMNKSPERTVVQPEAGRVIETAQPRAAGGANAPLVKRISVDKRRIADGAKVFRIDRNGGFETVFADRNPGPFIERARADAAIVRKKQRKNTVRNPANEIKSSRSR
jgi:hypothetical protein